jgi:hypothetical protein
MDKVYTVYWTDHKSMFGMMSCCMMSKCIYEVAYDRTHVACDRAHVLFTIFVLNVFLTLLDVKPK